MHHSIPDNEPNRNPMAVNRTWSAQELEQHSAFIKQYVEDKTPVQQLKRELINLKVQLQHYLLTGESPEIGPNIHLYLQAGLDALKTHLGITKKRIAQHWDITTRSLNQYLNGTKPIEPALAFKIAATFDWSPELLLDAQLKNNLEHFNQDQYNLQQLMAS